MFPVDTIQLLRQHHPGAAGDCAVLLGYFESGDGGWGVFFWHETSLEDDNGGTIIKPDGVPASTAGRWKRLYDGPLSVRWFGATANRAYTTDDTSAIRATIDAAVTDGRVDFPPGGDYHITSTITLPNRVFDIRGNGASVVVGTAPSAPAFRRIDHVFTRFEGLNFSGTGPGIEVRGIPSDFQSHDLVIEDCRFRMDSGVYGIELHGARESHIDHCDFKSNDEAKGPGYWASGIYLQQSCNVFVSGCYFDNLHRGIFYDGTNSRFDAGLQCTSNLMIGCTLGLHARMTGWLTYTNGIIDYCDQPILMEAVHGGNISSNYLYARKVDDCTPVHPAIMITEVPNAPSPGGPGLYPQPGWSDTIEILGNDICTATTADTDTLALDHFAEGSIMGNRVLGASRFCVTLDACLRTRIIGNHMAGAPGACSVKIRRNSEYNIIADNVVEQKMQAPLCNLASHLLDLVDNVSPTYGNSPYLFSCE
jgi:Right handed beta helix region